MKGWRYSWEVYMHVRESREILGGKKEGVERE
jgi:hypothetical protein